MGRVILSMIGSLTVSIAMFVLMPGIRNTRRTGDRLVAAAKAAGRVAQGTLIHSEYHPASVYDGPDRRRQDTWDVAYEYETDDFHGVFRGWMRFAGSPPPDIMPLYYESGHPQEACPENYGRYAEAGERMMLVAALPMILFLLFYFVVFG